MPLLAASEIRASLASVPEWTRRGSVIRRTFEFADFLAAMKFVNAVARAAEKAQHHPDIDIRWNRVTLALTTHDAGGLTNLDFALAARANALAHAK
ncbi:MAG TPA: 4a-hydroxytetrahydrobiopterin dehydratase [Verrucomicrobiota bacterium]|nr:4a-hydroxytetrahydrobiopterin dehydratase [Verrucomicrobiales bacterium]HRI12129.1 4a-hydroxytetrahydrobiopterin dehydratase [Verrucomicrobiota bacterium]